MSSETQATAPLYPEHEKLAKFKDESQLVGEFLDIGLPRLGIILYEERFFPCECSACEDRLGEHSQWHSEAEKESIIDGRVQQLGMFPTRRTIQQILADYFDIDQSKIDVEKEQMLAEIRGRS
jgi:hypothetical protein